MSSSASSHSTSVNWPAVARDAAERPWPIPARPWAMTMSWHDLLFAHWPVPAAGLRALVPSSVELDTFDGQAWLGVVPFRMSNVGPRGWPALPWLSAFAEINLRTYVRVGAKAGVYFFSLDAANPIAVSLARRAFRLPYFRARMRVARTDSTIHYASTRTHRGAPPAAFGATYRPTGAPYRSAAGTLEHWLTERYCLYATDRRGAPLCGEIQHRPWPLQPAAAEITVNSMADWLGVALPAAPPLLHFAERLDVVGWRYA